MSDRMTKEEHAKVLAALETCKTGGYRDIDGDWCKRQVFDEPAVAEAIAIMRKEPEPPTVKESLTVPVVKQSLTTEPISDAEIFDIAGNYDCGTNGENMEWTFKSQKELLDFSRALLEKAR